MTEFKVPELGENIASGDVTRVLVSVGDTIKPDQPVLELETDKATVELPSTVAGVVREIRVKAGDKIKVGAVVLTVDDGDGGAVMQSSAAAAAEPALRGEPGAAAEPADERAERPAADGSKVLAMRQRGGPGGGKAEETRTAVEPPATGRVPAGGAPAPAARADEAGPAVPASPAVRRLAREIGVDVSQVQGTGPAGRISQDDVKEHARRILSSVGSAGAAAGPLVRAERPLPDFQKWGEVDRQAWSNIRRTTSEHLSHAWTAIPHVTQFDKADVTALDGLRRKYKDQVAAAGGNLTMTAMLVRILAAAVTQFPQFNASLDAARGEIIYKRYVNVGVAVDTERGLLVPVIRQADRKSITRIAIELDELARRARDRKLTLDEMSGGGITISNLGGIGGTYFTPIINWPEVAILGVSRSVTEPVWRTSNGAEGGAFEPRQMLPLSLSYDHRVIDGADAMRFLRWVVDAIEQPFLLSLIG